MTTRKMSDLISSACGWSIDRDPTNDYLYRTADGRGMFSPAACLNAMHEAVMGKLTEPQFARFTSILAGLVRQAHEERAWAWSTEMLVASATASELAEAFLRTLNLWEE